MRLQVLRHVPAVLIYLAAAVVPAGAQVRVETSVSGLSRPVAFVQDPSDSSVRYVTEQAGLIKVVNGGTLQPTPFLDISSSVASDGERGLLGLAFPPNYGTSGRFFVFFTNTSGDVVVSRFNRSAGSRFIADRDSRFDLQWSTGQRFIEHSARSNHNGGCIAFGPDGMLYIAVGDGGGSNDPDNNAQNTSALLGKILRVDVTSSSAAASPNGFVVPEGNPGLPRPEIWSYGWRNPWRFSFDTGPGGTSALVVADVGQGGWEEIDYEPAGRPGRNYGWRYREGAHAYIGTPPGGLPLVDPIFEYGRTSGASVTGGYVYRGATLPSMRGRYIFADYVSRRVWSITLASDSAGEGSAGGLVEHTGELGTLGGISSFGVDSSGELYIVDHTRGLVLRLAGAPRSPTNVRIIRE